MEKVSLAKIVDYMMNPSAANGNKLVFDTEKQVLKWTPKFSDPDVGKSLADLSKEARYYDNPYIDEFALRQELTGKTNSWVEPGKVIRYLDSRKREIIGPEYGDRISDRYIQIPESNYAFLSNQFLHSINIPTEMLAEHGLDVDMPYGLFDPVDDTYWKAYENIAYEFCEKMRLEVQCDDFMKIVLIAAAKMWCRQHRVEYDESSIDEWFLES